MEFEDKLKQLRKDFNKFERICYEWKRKDAEDIDKMKI